MFYFNHFHSEKEDFQKDQLEHNRVNNRDIKKIYKNKNPDWIKLKIK